MMNHDTLSKPLEGRLVVFADDLHLVASGGSPRRDVHGSVMGDESRLHPRSRVGERIRYQTV